MENDLDLRFQAAVQGFWTGRNDALQRQIDSGVIDAGQRGAVTSGGHMSEIEALIVDLLLETGLDRSEVVVKGRGVKPEPRLELPGYYRPEKQWDLITLVDGHLVTAIEFKSMVGSVGNNFNNRAEEAIGLAADFWTAFREGRFGHVRPFLGYLFVLRDEPRIHTPVSVRQPYFPVDPQFVNASYVKRYQILCQRLVTERLYDATCVALATQDTPPVISFPDSSVSFAQFAAQLQGHASGIARMRSVRE